MDPHFWLDRWQRREIGFHQAEINLLLQRHWHALNLPPGSHVLVPLAGMSRDMIWLAGQGHLVTGVELSDEACAEFFEREGLTPQTAQQGAFIRRRDGAITLLSGDIFDLPDAFFDDVCGIYDRGALVALPSALRRRYVDSVYGRAPAQAQALLIALDYPQAQMSGPPFAIDDAELQALFGRRWTRLELERRDILADEPRYQQAGLSSLHSSAWLLQHAMPGGAPTTPAT